jgi:hypothetical protein
MRHLGRQVEVDTRDMGGDVDLKSKSDRIRVLTEALRLTDGAL